MSFGADPAHKSLGIGWQLCRIVRTRGGEIIGYRCLCGQSAEAGPERGATAQATLRALEARVSERIRVECPRTAIGGIELWPLGNNSEALCGLRRGAGLESTA